MLPKPKPYKLKNGKTITLYKPMKSNRSDKKRMVYVLDDGRVKLLHYGATGYTHNTSKEQWQNYRARASKIKLKDGRLAYKVVTQPNFWAYWDLWRDKWTK